MAVLKHNHVKLLPLQVELTTDMNLNFNLTLVNNDCCSNPCYNSDSSMYSVRIADVAYVALGLSNDGQMGGDSVMECIIDNGNVLLFTSYNNRRSNIRDGVVRLDNLID